MSTNHQCHAHDAATSPSETAIDPVCGMTVDPAATPHHAHFAGRDYHFCSAKCRERFETRPEVFLDEAARPAPEHAVDVVFTCPMHPEIEQIGPGLCPICGMALEPKTFAPTEGPSC